MTTPLISYPSGSTVERTPVLALTRTAGALLFAVERTPCHPESPRWPDQPADRCTLLAAGTTTTIECLEGSLQPSTGERAAALSLGPPDGADTDAMSCVVHRAPLDTALELGAEVTLSVEQAYRERLSRSHSRCHVVTLALNQALADAWRKDPPRRDSLGNPDFDALAIVSSKIDERGSLDTYRIGKHMRKSGFPAEALGDAEALALIVKQTAAAWIAASPMIAVTPGVCALTERRTWSCELPVGSASFPCGGTHARQLTPDQDFTVGLTFDPEAKHFTMDVRDA